MYLTRRFYIALVVIILLLGSGYAFAPLFVIGQWVLFAFFQQKTGNFSKNLAFWKQVCYIHTSVKNVTKEAVPCLEASTS